MSFEFALAHAQMSDCSHVLTTHSAFPAPMSNASAEQEEESRTDGTAAATADAATAKRLGLQASSSSAALLIEHLLRAMHAGGDAGNQGNQLT